MEFSSHGDFFCYIDTIDFPTPPCGLPLTEGKKRDIFPSLTAPKRKLMTIHKQRVLISMYQNPCIYRIMHWSF